MILVPQPLRVLRLLFVVIVVKVEGRTLLFKKCNVVLSVGIQDKG